MKMQSRKIWYYRITLIILLFAVLLAWALLPGVHEFINRSVAAFAAVDQQGIERFIQSYGALAAVVSFLLMILQAIAAPLPAFLITFANASLFGAFWGGLLSWTSSMAGAALCFFIARVMGREVVEKLTGKTVLDSMDGFFTRYGKQPRQLWRPRVQRPRRGRGGDCRRYHDGRGNELRRTRRRRAKIHKILRPLIG